MPKRSKDQTPTPRAIAIRFHMPELLGRADKVGRTAALLALELDVARGLADRLPVTDDQLDEILRSAKAPPTRRQRKALRAALSEVLSNVAAVKKYFTASNEPTRRRVFDSLRQVRDAAKSLRTTLQQLSPEARLLLAAEWDTNTRMLLEAIDAGSTKGIQVPADLPAPPRCADIRRLEDAARGAIDRDPHSHQWNLADRLLTRPTALVEHHACDQLARIHRQFLGEPSKRQFYAFAKATLSLAGVDLGESIAESARKRTATSK